MVSSFRQGHQESIWTNTAFKDVTWIGFQTCGVVGLLAIFENVEGTYQCRLNAGMAAARKPCTVTCWRLILHTVNYTLGAGHVVIFYAHIT